MAFADWMVITPSLEQEFKLESDAKAILTDDHHHEVAKLCAQLNKQNWYQQQVIVQATDHIRELEARLALLDAIGYDEHLGKSKKLPWPVRLWNLNITFFLNNFTKY
tara:strand:+ start:564 stop:884 length:321 start_codon:yes stop_codon:yes gene_type:complete